MAYQPYGLIGSVGTVSIGAASAAVTPAWGTGANRTVGNLLIGLVAVGNSGSDPATPTGWTLGVRKSASPGCAINVFYKTATGSDTAPTFSGVTSAVLSCQLLEFLGNQNTINFTANAITATGLNPLDTTENPASELGGLVIVACAALMTTAETYTLTPSCNNVSSLNVTNSSSSTKDKYGFGYGYTNINSFPSTYGIATMSTSANFSDMAVVIMAMNLNSGFLSFM